VPVILSPELDAVVFLVFDAAQADVPARGGPAVALA